MTFTIKGESTDAEVKGVESAFDETFMEQVGEMVDHQAFQNSVKLMPDGHAGAGAVIGFTMPVGDRVVPNTVGVDIGCGMFSLNLGKNLFENVPEYFGYTEIDDLIREKVPMGRNVFDFDEQDYHIIDDFPWDECQATLEEFSENQGVDISEFQGYGKQYFLDTCQKANYDTSRAINSIGTLGGGNHFIEITRSTRTGDFWVTVHSGSRGIGLKIAQYWQQAATDFTSARKNLDDVPEETRKYLKSNWKPDGERIRSDFDGEAIQRKFDEVSAAIQEYGPNSDNRNTDLDWLEGEEATGYFIDMIFAQKYASESRKQIAYTVADVLDVDPKDSIESVHNFVDFRDGVIRKGATRADEGERVVIPFNMADGTIVCEGKGNSEWNFSAPHGAGRRMSRTQAFDELSFEDFKQEMNGIFSTSVTEDTLDEAPMAYKDTAVIESVIEETADIVDRWEVVHNIKAEE